MSGPLPPVTPPIELLPLEALNIWAEEQGRDNALSMASFPVTVVEEDDEDEETESIQAAEVVLANVSDPTPRSNPRTFSDLKGEKASLQQSHNGLGSSTASSPQISLPTQKTTLNLLPGSINVYPNPVRSKANFRFVAEQNGAVQLIIYRLTGQKISQQNLMVTAGEQQLSASLEGLPGGIYLYKITGVGGEFNGRLIKK